MIGHNAPHHIHSTEDARIVASTIAALRAEIECIEEAHRPALDYLQAQIADCRNERDDKTEPLAERMESLRLVLRAWLSDDPDGSIKDGDRIVATLSRKAGTPKVDADKVPSAYKTMQPNMSAINAALARGVKIEGVSVPVTTILRVL